MKVVKKFQSIIWGIVFFAMWEIAARSGVVNNYILPPFSLVVNRMIEELLAGKLLIQIFNSLGIILIGFLISIAIALVISVLCIKSKISDSFFATLCTLMDPLPGMAILPLIMLWFGIGNGAMLALIVHGVVWPIVTNLLVGFRNVPVVYKEWAENIGMGSFRKFKDIYFFAVMPYMLSGLRIGWGRAWRALVSAEMVFGMIGSLGGIGYYIYVNRAYGNITNVLVGVLLIILIGVFVETVVFRNVERITVDKWGENKE